MSLDYGIHGAPSSGSTAEPRIPAPRCPTRAAREWSGPQGKFRRQDLLFTAALMLLVITLTMVIRRIWTFSTDDAYITLRYAENWLHHGRLTWNLAENPPVEGYSNTFHLLLAALALLVGAPPLLAWKLTGVAALAGTCVLLLWWITKLAERWTALLAVTFYACYAGTVWWTVSGLETPVYVFLTLSALVLFDRSRVAATPSRRNRLLGTAGVVVFLCGLTRPEGPVVGILLGLWLIAECLASRTPVRVSIAQTLWLALPFAFPYAAFFAARYAHFGRPWPNTFYCKAAYNGDPWTLIRAFLEVGTVPLLIGLPGFFGKAANRWRLLLIYGFIILNTALYYGIDPIIGHLNRHLLTSLALAGAAMALGLHVLLGRVPPRLRGWVASAFVLLTVCACLANLPNLAGAADRYAARMETRARLAAYLRSIPVADYAIGDAGMVPYQTPGVPVYDYYGLNSREFVSPAINRDISKYAAWLLKRQPHAVVLVSRHPRYRLSRNATQNALAAVFNEKTGYLDQQVSFGDPRDNYHYRVLLSDTPSTHASPVGVSQNDGSSEP